MDAVKLLGSLLGNNATDGNMLGSLLKGAMGGGNAGGGNSPLGLLGGLLGGGGQQSSGVAGILGSILGGGNAGQAQQQASGGGLGGILGGLLGGGDAAAATQAPPQPQVDEATLLIRAMCNAAKADGHIDKDEQEKIVGRLGGDIGQAEADFLRKELGSPLDVAGFCQSVPANMAANVYAFSAMTVRVDTREEVAYLQQLAQGLNLDNNTLSHIHQQLGLA